MDCEAGAGSTAEPPDSSSGERIPALRLNNSLPPVPGSRRRHFGGCIGGRAPEITPYRANPGRIGTAHPECYAYADCGREFSTVSTENDRLLPGILQVSGLPVFLIGIERGIIHCKSVGLFIAILLFIVKDVGSFIAKAWDYSWITGVIHGIFPRLSPPLRLGRGLVGADTATGTGGFDGRNLMPPRMISTRAWG